MAAGKPVPQISTWSASLFKTLRTAKLVTPAEQSAYDRWFSQRADRQVARYARLHGADGVIPTQLWIALFFIAAIIFAYVLFFADSGERAIVQGMLMGSVVAVITITLLLIRVLDDPYGSALGGLKPVAMERTLATIDGERRILGAAASPPCNAQGRPRRNTPTTRPAPPPATEPGVTTG